MNDTNILIYYRIMFNNVFKNKKIIGSRERGSVNRGEPEVRSGHTNRNRHETHWVSPLGEVRVRLLMTILLAIRSRVELRVEPLLRVLRVG